MVYQPRRVLGANPDVIWTKICDLSIDLRFLQSTINVLILPKIFVILVLSLPTTVKPLSANSGIVSVKIIEPPLIPAPIIASISLSITS